MTKASNYVVQLAEKTHCPECMKYVFLLCRRDGDIHKPWFYVCFDCCWIAEIGKGPCEWVELSTSIM